MLKLMATLFAAAALLAACERDSAATKSGPGAPASSSSGASQTSSTPTTPANAGAPKSMEERREGANPTQQQVDPKESAQHRDFQQKGDDKGPTSAETKPRN